MSKKTLSEMLEWIEERIVSNITIDDLTQFTGYSRRFIHDIFRRYLDISPGQYIKQRKLCMAANLFKLTSQSGCQIALELGFSSQQSLCREFKKAFGVTPGEYRKREYWDTSQLLPPVKATESFNGFISKAEVVNLLDIILEGFETSHVEALPYKATNRQQPRGKNILKKIKEKKQSVYVASEYKKTNNNTNMVHVVTFTGVRFNFGNTQQIERRKIISGGVFAKFMFCGDWEAYQRLPDYIYRLKLTEANLVRRDGPDIELFKFNKKEVVCEDYVECSYYVPIISSN
ncbi:AraC family transcriptional regulator [Yokenella regensburgei]|uniref:AraC family transcriptional regulator n=1 Tax=Yokenella regensburgei TaxID=158877 RepID=A0ABX9S2K7_9ENTR|nr:helix-turn-helix domain-containing protein [Yokenella regensburgei]RKR64984.1 AraC family transcriptional regulator [Yokenella regensburgei]VFS14518.1 Right origin-binding protein [Yokenella regensburgei]